MSSAKACESGALSLAQGLARPPSGPKTASSASSGGGGLFSRVGLVAPVVQVTLREDILFLRPTPKGEPSDDPVLEGTVTLILPKKRVLSKLTVRLVGKQDISFGDLRASESAISLDKEISLTESDLTLEKGEHQFAFAFIVPSNTACYERCQYGRVKHSVTVKAKGIGGLGGDALSVSKSVIFIVNPGGGGANAPPPGLHHRLEGVLDEVGPYAISLQSQHLMVGGLLLLRLFFPAPSCHLLIHSIRVVINQQFSTSSPTNPSRIATLPLDRRTIINLDSSAGPNSGAPNADTRPHRHQGPPLKLLRPGEPYQIHHLARLLDHDILRPTTQPLTESAIRVRHDAAVEVIYEAVPPPEEQGRSASKDRVGKGKEKGHEPKKMIISKPLDLYSCCSLVDSLTLPPYESEEAVDEDRQHCLCGYSMDHLLSHSGHGRRLDLGTASAAAISFGDHQVHTVKPGEDQSVRSVIA